MSLKTGQELRDIIASNILRMVHYRKWISDEIFEANIKTKHQQDIYVINTNSTDDHIPKTIAITLSNQRMNSLSKSSSNILNQFLTKYEKVHKIIVFKEYPEKLKNQLEEKYSNVEIFDEEFFKVDIGSHIIVPKHKKLSKTEADEVIKSYGKESQFPILMSTDPMSRYLYVKQNDLIEIVRPNRNSGYEIFYRIVK
jgi:DNA-directed RNA polymerase subunit H (RpoH/RPB5)